MTDETVFMPYLQPHDVKEILRQDAELDREDAQARVEADRVRRAADEAAAEAQAENLRQAFSVAEPPDDLDVDTTNLSPMRARLVRYHAWVVDLERQHEQLVTGRSAYLQAMGVPAATQAAIDKLIKQDRDGLIGLIAAGGKISKPQLRDHERRALEAKLEKDSHAAEISRQAMDEIDSQIATLEQQIPVLHGRRNEFVADALTEHCQMTDGARLVAEGAALQTSCCAGCR
jgi:hypothetical protein